MKKFLVIAAIVLAAGVGIWAAQTRQAQIAATEAARVAAEAEAAATAAATAAAEAAAAAAAEAAAAVEAATGAAVEGAAAQLEALRGLFTAEGFDAARLIEAVGAATTLDEATRTMALGVIEQIRANPALGAILLPRLERLLTP